MKYLEFVRAYRRKLPPWVRFAIWGTGQIAIYVLMIGLIWVWLPLMIVLYLVGIAVTNVHDFYVSYKEDHPTEIPDSQPSTIGEVQLEYEQDFFLKSSLLPPDER